MDVRRREIAALKVRVGVREAIKDRFARNSCSGGRTDADRGWRLVDRDGQRFLGFGITGFIHAPKLHGMDRITTDGERRAGEHLLSASVDLKERSFDA